jgi:hypothetical protein
VLSMNTLQACVERVGRSLFPHAEVRLFTKMEKYKVCCIVQYSDEIGIPELNRDHVFAISESLKRVESQMNDAQFAQRKVSLTKVIKVRPRRFTSSLPLPWPKQKAVRRGKL